MGTNCAPLLTNLYLFYYEYNHMKKLIKNNFLQERKFNDTVRYIDDLITLNNPGFFRRNIEYLPTRVSTEEDI